MFSIGRAESVYIVPRENPAASDVRLRGDRVLRDRLPEILPRIMEATFPGPSVWLIERLDIDLAFAADTLDDDALAHLWSQEIVRALTTALRKREKVLCFETRAAFIAQYVSDVTAGRAAGRWYYAPFASLAALPAASAIREAIAREPAIAFDVLAELARMRRLRFVIDALSDRGAREVWEIAFPSSESESDPSATLVELLLSTRDTITQSLGADVATLDRATLARAALHLVASVLEPGSISLSPHDAAKLRTHIDTLLAFAILLETTRDPWLLLESIIDGDATTAIIRTATRDRIPDLATLRFFTRLATTRPDLVTCAASTLLSNDKLSRSDQTDRETRESVAFSPPQLHRIQSSPLSPPQPHRIQSSPLSPPQPHRGGERVRVRGPLTQTPLTSAEPTRFAALALLLPPLIDLAIFPAEDNAHLRRLIIARCAGPNHAREATFDPIMRLLGDPNEPTERSAEEATRRDLMTTLASITVMKSFAARLPGFAHSSFEHLRQNFFTGSGTIRFAEDRIDVQLPSLPLAIVLRMTGMHERSFAVPWLPDRIVTLRLPEGM